MLATVPLIGLAVLRSLPWASATVLREHRRTRDRVVVPAPVLSGLAVGVVAATVIGALLASADADFAAVLSDVGGWLSIDVPRADVLVARVLTLGFVALTVLGLGFAASARLRPGRARPREARSPAAWLTPLVLVALTITAFLAVEATRLFGGEAVLHETSTTHAARAREGFGQLIVVTVLVLLLVGWAGRAAAGQHRRAMAAGGGALLVLALLLAVSALRRLWLYQDHFGWTVARLNAGAFELWVVVVLLAVAAAWLVRRTDLLPRLVAGSAGLGLLVIALAGPDALVAAADVRRYEQGKGIDTVYLSTLSEDAVPALVRLPEPVRACALPGPSPDQPWYAWNLSRERAEDLLSTETLTACAR